jgi:CRISPR-associated protein Csm4
MTFHLFKLYFRTPLHISRGKQNTYADSSPSLHSDTLKSAIFATAMELYGTEVANEEFFQQFWLSSAFPFVGDVFYFPKPLGFNPKATSDLRKEIKKTQYLSKSIFERVLRNDPGINAKEILDQEGKASNPLIFKRHLTQRVQILDQESTPFYIDKLYPVEGNRGLYFLVQNTGDTDSLLNKLEGILSLLGDNGLGLQRKLGNGQFRCERSALTLDLPDSASAAISLSLYLPTEAEFSAFDWESSCCDFTQRGGWISSPQKEEQLTLRKRSRYFFSEGSVLVRKDGNVLPTLGSYADFRPELPGEMEQIGHPVWRDGRALFLPIEL